MNPTSLFCFFLCLIAVAGDRVYVHPFALFAYNRSSCKDLENLIQEEKTFVPIFIKSQAIPAYEEQPKPEMQSLGANGNQRLSYLKDLAYVLGVRFYGAIRETRKGQNILLSPTSIYGSLVSFYLVASGQTAADLQDFLGFISPSGDPDCTSKVDGRKVLSALRTIDDPLLTNTADDLFFSKLSCLFSAPNVRLAEPFVRDLALAADAFYARAVDFTNPRQAVEQINTFVEAKVTRRSNSLLTDIDPTTTLLFTSEIHLKANLKKASQLKEPQEFWIDSSTKILVPMMSVTGLFQYKRDARKHFSITTIPITKNALLVLVQPINGNDLNTIESEISLQSSDWLQDLSPRRIKLSLPQLTLESTYDLQELLVNMNLSTLLGKEADLSKISSANPTVGKVINKAFFKLNNLVDEVEDPSEQNEDVMPMEVTLNNPFLLAIYEENSKAMLFLGRVANPLNGV
ncbi:PREDICTED: angiotensinogen [Gavialis gangeticus]|uniref:angiotensinogen n=1 Tax=Gavialis gangeticus TaxID=94835 RepID=UPI00092F7527|nr:PREDICTED: angiotensinogen [Gavialis gangeticus]XP_019383186.1 PREDICTED: angiotensinogen [Gavialis gangeticus]XP_019383187.1 PREDICTED: angiotensinogen [Gavialis gangeticus]